jgi:acetyl-CoA carboxylase biotin carboxyl carrier protein
MDLSLVKKLVKLLSESDVDEIEIEEEGKKVRIAKHPQRVAPPVTWSHELPGPGVTPPPAIVAGPAAGVAPASVPAAIPVPAPAAAPPANIVEIRSPIVGTFYRAPAPDAAPFVQVGSDVRSGTVLCIVEAMKLMNEIESDVAGKVARVMVENGQPVEYDQVLFLIEKT